MSHRVDKFRRALKFSIRQFPPDTLVRLKFLVTGSLLTVIDFFILNIFVWCLRQYGIPDSTPARVLTFIIMVGLAFKLHGVLSFSDRVRAKGSRLKIVFWAVNLGLSLLALVPFVVLDILLGREASIVSINLLNFFVIGSFAVVRYVIYNNLFWPKGKKFL